MGFVLGLYLVHRIVERLEMLFYFGVRYSICTAFLARGKRIALVDRILPWRRPLVTGLVVGLYGCLVFGLA